MESRKPIITPEELNSTVAKVFKNDSTALLNSLLQRHAVMEEVKKDERAREAVIKILHGPLVKVTSGVGLTLAGLLLAITPGVVLRAKTEGEVDEHGNKHERLTNLAFDVRATKTPLHATRYEMVVDEYGDAEPEFKLEDTPQNQLEVLAAFLGKSVDEVKQLIKDEILAQSDEDKREQKQESAQMRKKLSAGATITGYGLLTTGLGRTLNGVTDLVVGGTRSLIHGGKSLGKYLYHENKKADDVIRDVLGIEAPGAVGSQEEAMPDSSSSSTMSPS